MYDLTLKNVKLFKFSNESGNHVDIYVESISQQSGKLIISTPARIYQRCFADLENGIFPFLKSMPIDLLPAEFEIPRTDMLHLQGHLIPVWDHFLETIEVFA